ncbi:MAG: membrane protein insertion efficiency factor YidD [Patescibacteria group bacterium]
MIPRYTILKMIRIYQKTLSFDHGLMKFFYPNGYCRFYPTCSEYGYQAIEKHGVINGGLLTIRRIVRCNPFNKGGIDEVPK